MLWTPWTADAVRTAGDRLVAVFVDASWHRWSRALAGVLATAEIAEAAAPWLTLRVDADLRPDLAARFAPAGVPVLALLAPGGDPLLSTGYAPPRTIREALRGAALQWEIRRPVLLEQARRARESARAMAAMRPAPGRADAAFVASVVGELVDSCDPVSGGWGSGSREVHAASLRLLAARRDLPGAAEALERTLAGLRRGAMRSPGGGFYHSSDTPDWTAPDGLELASDLADLHAAFGAGSEESAGIAVRLRAMRRADGLVPVAATEDGAPHAATAESSARAAAAAPDLFPDSLLDPAAGLFRRTAGAGPPFHLSDQAAALDVLSARDPESAARLADAVLAAFWDDGASAFRDRAGAPPEPGLLDLPQFPFEANALAAGALARLGVGKREIARRCLASFTDACFGQGSAAARLALAVGVYMAGGLLPPPLDNSSSMT
ncbi:MAG: hypothetical protein HYY18_03240 [Planctomycetes bacterium]|nr:hypothetical protein [Planctomycetota bacterium]